MGGDSILCKSIAPDSQLCTIGSTHPQAYMGTKNQNG